MGPAPFYGGKAEPLSPPKKNADFAMKQTNICRLSGDITTHERTIKQVQHNCSISATYRRKNLDENENKK